MPHADTLPPLDPFDPDLEPLRNIVRRELPIEPSPPTLWRWHQKGRRGRKLRTIKIANVVCTTPGELRNFLLETQDRVEVETPSIEERVVKAGSKLEAALA